ncbi:RES domain-containing protein (plasmid) [Xanthomonas citri pv. citri]|uniref:RES domain-containing protein n=1 Tax=Xanthomonas citri TaxID=346 RepID=UPI0019316BAE|nr:RES domain-containing protein [Xanthomonas citri]QRD62615.1 RES domain-containing protein [Xanthomonas citri pv. citri]QRD67149.1 RES domain-containing protein [Xanthomonas citri pv. citri]QRD71805.1 RES domain-containing protein [Xanthomonas citri pv. citri]
MSWSTLTSLQGLPMPAGSPWLNAEPQLDTVPLKPLWHVYKRGFDALAPNPVSRARMALVGTHAMFYAADTAAGALWETVLRSVYINARGAAQVLPAYLAGFDLVPIVALRDDLPLLPLGPPGIRRLFPNPNSPEAQAVATLLHQPIHELTHGEAAALHAELKAVGIPDMPVLSWPSRMHHTSTAYLAYAPKMDASWWQETGVATPLDSPAGMALVDAALAQSGFHRAAALATSAIPTPPPDDVA